MLRATALLSAALLLSACGSVERAEPEQPAFYLSMAKGGAVLDSQVAASMISGYRRNNGLGAVTVDPELTRLAEAQSMAMAKRNKLDHDVAGTLVQRIKASGYDAVVAVENVSAGYHTLAEAFSGWRDSPPHRDNMLKRGVTKMGIAASYAPNTKYKVFWTLILAAPDVK
ncbi:MAG TPA: CAP domain-containing protein [Xanthobacteraceae bacterium]|nr:CAP domain-containing protein [Xanthobacteraceae bacterium]